MNYVIADIETDGLLDTVSKFHVGAWRDHEGNHGTTRDIQEFCALLDQYEYVVGHNWAGYDRPALEILNPGWVQKAKTLDTLVFSRMSWAQRDLAEQDKKMFRAKKEAYMPAPTSPTAKFSPLTGSYSLKAWGYRLGVLKGDFGETTDWSEYSPEMEAYCAQDVEVTTALWDRIRPMHDLKAFEIEMALADIFERQKAAGVQFDLEKARALHAELASERQKVTEEILAMHDGWEETYFTEKRKEEKTRWVPFNPNSRPMIERLLRERHGWEPKEYTDSGRAKLDERVYATLDYPEAKLLLKQAQLQKALGTLSDGPQSYLNCVEEDGRIHGTVLPTGTVTGRTAHRRPDLNVPKKGKPFAEEFRSLFTVPEGKVLVGADASGLELRCLAHYLARYDKGRFAEILLEGDIHTANQEAAGLDTRDQAKTFIYAFLYGAGDAKIGEIVGGGQRQGRDLKARFMAKTPGLARLVEGVQRSATTKKFLVSILGRKMSVRSKHAALNTLLQGCGADVMKVATVLMDEAIRDLDGFQVLHKHDEYQFECLPEDAEKIGHLAVDSIRRAGHDLDMRVALDGEFQVGPTWAETH